LLFNSIDFAVFLPIVFTVYWVLNKTNLKWQNLFIVVASYVFYGWWDYRFLSLILFSTLVDYFVGLNLKDEANVRKRKLLLFLSIGVNLGFLGFFKYYNFFVESFVDAFSILGTRIQPNTLNIILPVGISFYTFQTLSYTIDVYNKKLAPTRDFIAFAAYVSFFPQLVAGPIERATNLLPQFFKKREFLYTDAIDGLKQMLWGMFKKVVIADNAALYANEIFANSDEHSGSTLLLGSFFFAFQIYGDFSGYSDIAIGTSRLFGFNLMRNFAYPYFSRDIAEFWRRWHISLSTWFRDYLYIPLGGSKGGTSRKLRNTFIIFIVSGFWHGANWTFIFWGALNALYFVPLLLTNSNRKNMGIVAEGRMIPNMKEVFGILTTFILTLFAWIFFRAENLNHAFRYVSGIFSTSFFQLPNFMDYKPSFFWMLLLLIVIEWAGRTGEYGIQKVTNIKQRYLRWSIYYMILVSIILFRGRQQEFIYFQF
jgi:D-alanyl-lipoteichoic acid acyltransferase DltB (MBOAT superfamily)